MFSLFAAASRLRNVDELDPDLTDESSLVERLGVKVTIVEGSSRNIKITSGRFDRGGSILKAWLVSFGGLWTLGL